VASTPTISPSISVIVPAMNEAANLPHVLPYIPDYVDEVILVDGHSTDDTVAVAQRLLPNIRIVPQHGKGKGSALRTGFSAAHGDIIVMLDADGSTDPREIPAFVEKLVKGADFVKGSRFMRGGGTADMPVHRKLGNAAFVGMVRLLFGGAYTDLCYGYNAFWSWTVPMLELDGSGFEIETMMNVRALRAGFNVAEVPSFEHARVYGVGRLRTVPDGIRVLKTIFRERLRPAPQQVSDVAPTHVAAIVPIRSGMSAIAIENESISWPEPVFAETSAMEPQESMAIG
jgi:glycosyltransferase involved in cell wall biosynthesis